MIKIVFVNLYLVVRLFGNSFYSENNFNLPHCGFDLLIHQKMKNDINYKLKMNNTVSQSKNLINQLFDDDVYKIPVVFHVLYNNDEQNIPDYVFDEQIQQLNLDYRRQNNNANETREIFLDIAGDTKIEFYLAEIDSEGDSTNGITRTFTQNLGFEFIEYDDLILGEITLNNVKKSNEGGIDPWDTERYLNIWVCNIEGGNFGQIMGFTYPPIEINEALNFTSLDAQPFWGNYSFQVEDSALQGIVINYTAIGPANLQAEIDGLNHNDLGRTLVHEVGHYLGLRHIWGDAILNNGCEMDDGINDTPSQANYSFYNCDFSMNSCEDEGEIILPDMVENYMDYSSEHCMNMFTINQIEVMRAVLQYARPHLFTIDMHCEMGDLNSDGDININDIIEIINLVLSSNFYFCGDLNNDLILNIIDAVLLVEFITGT